MARCAFCECEANPLRTLGGSNRSRCGAVRILRTLCALGGSNRSPCGAMCILSMRSEPSACFGWVKPLSLWRGAHFEHAKNPLRALGGSNRCRCGAVRILSAQSEPSGHFGWVEPISLWCGAHLETKVSFRSVDHKCPSDVVQKC